MEDEEQLQLPVAPAAPAVPVNNSVKLPAFWPANIAAWFASVEGIFELRNITSQRARYFNVLAALPEATVVLVADLIETNPLPADPFDWLKARLVTAHQLTDIQRVEKLLSLPAMGQQKPSELLAEMIRICPRGEENSVFFNCLFLQKLPRELRVFLSEADMADKRLFSGRADQIWAHNTQLHHDTVAVVTADPEGSEGAVAAVQTTRGGQGGRRGVGGSRGGQQRQGQRSRGAGGGGGQPRATGAQAAAATPMLLAKHSAGLCDSHWKYGDAAFVCNDPGSCKWQGN
jgi:hypothetical protein